MNVASQNVRILRYLKGGARLTPLEALHHFGTMRLGARVYELRQMGLNIRSRLVERNGRHVAEYWLVR